MDCYLGLVEEKMIIQNMICLYSTLISDNINPKREEFIRDKFLLEAYIKNFLMERWYLEPL